MIQIDRRWSLIALLALALTQAPPAMGESGKRIKLTARQCAWSPTRVEVVQGSRVVIDLASTEGDHRFALPAFRLTLELKEGHKGQVEFVANRVGEFEWNCTHAADAPCKGSGGILVVSSD
jgi:heme/copper-type cytochrome/quinol oxidase subunit 2